MANTAQLLRHAKYCNLRKMKILRREITNKKLVECY